MQIDIHSNSNCDTSSSESNVFTRTKSSSSSSIRSILGGLFIWATPLRTRLIVISASQWVQPDIMSIDMLYRIHMIHKMDHIRDAFH